MAYIAYIIGFILALILISKFLKLVGSIFSGGKNKKQQPLTIERYLSTDSKHFTLEFVTDEKRNEILRINNPFRGVLVIGGAGSGKSETFANPIIYQSVVKGYAGIIYDYKFLKVQAVFLLATTLIF